MARCDVCGNDYDKSFTITGPSGGGTFDSFECAIHALAPTCTHCGCKIVGHGAEHDGRFYCCAHCARESGVKGIDDRI
jgi:Rieske Fe-S protein